MMFYKPHDKKFNKPILIYSQIDKMTSYQENDDDLIF